MPVDGITVNAHVPAYSTYRSTGRNACLTLNPQQRRQLVRRVAGACDHCTPLHFKITAERQTSRASLEALPVTNLASFEATINPDGPVKNNIIVCRVNN